MTKPNLTIEQADDVIRKAAFLAKRGGPKDMPEALRQEQMAMARAQAAAHLAVNFEIEIPKGKFADKVEAERAGETQRAVG